MKKAIILIIALLAAVIFASMFEHHETPVPRWAQHDEPPKPLTEAEQKAQRVRSGARDTIESKLLDAGYDVRVGWLDKESDRDHTLQLVIIGAQVNRPFVHTLLRPGFRRSLQRDGFKRILFCRNDIDDWIAEYYPQSDEPVWD